MAQGADRRSVTRAATPCAGADTCIRALLLDRDDQREAWAHIPAYAGNSKRPSITCPSSRGRAGRPCNVARQVLASRPQTEGSGFRRQGPEARQTTRRRSSRFENVRRSAATGWPLNEATRTQIGHARQKSVRTSEVEVCHTVVSRDHSPIGWVIAVLPAGQAPQLGVAERSNFPMLRP